jgi:HAD superfamily hydrolase (TIGR01549 family)
MNSLTVFFDVGGTLVDSPDFFETISRRLTDDGHLDKKAYQLVTATFLQMYGKREMRSSFLNVEGMLSETLTSISREYGYKDISGQSHDLVFEVYLYKASLYREAVPVLDRMMENGVRMIIASDADTELMEKELAKFKISKYFVDICVSGSVRAYKPAAGFIDYLKKYTLHNEESCYFVGDNLVDIESGRRLGIKSVLVNRKDAGKPVNADYIIHDLMGLLPILKIDPLHPFPLDMTG